MHEQETFPEGQRKNSLLWEVVISAQNNSLKLNTEQFS